MTPEEIKDARALVERLRLGGDYAHDTEPMRNAADTLTAALDEVERLRMERDELDALLNEGIATDDDTRRQARAEARAGGIKEAADIAEARDLGIGNCRDQEARKIKAFILDLLDTPAPMRCAECTCENGGADCNWIKTPAPDDKGICPHCMGSGEDVADQPCPTCGGSGADRTAPAQPSVQEGE